MAQVGTGVRKSRTYSRLFFKVFGNYALMVILFAIVLGVTFIRLYQNTNMTDNVSTLERQAKSIAGELQEYNEFGDYDTGRGYLSIVSSLDGIEIWVIRNVEATAPLNEYLTNTDLVDIEIMPEMEGIIQNVYTGEIAHETYYSEIHGVTIMTVGVPVYNGDKEVCGAVLLNQEFSSLDEGISNIQSLIIVSAGLAMLVSGILAFLFTRRLTVPISMMRTTALQLARGNYEEKTGIVRNDEIGELARTVDFLTDKLQENEIERQNLERMRIDFFANVSHELRTPITVIRAFTESLVDGVVSDEAKKAQYYQRMLHECKSMERLVGDLLTLSKMQNPDFIIESEPINLVQVFDDIVRSITKIAEEKEVSIQIKKNCDVAMMLGDYDRLRQMFMVILDNAIKFSREKGEVIIEIRKGEALAISIKDNGIGIKKEDLPYVFEKFYKSNLKQNAQGSGLGLAIAKQIAIKHNGTIRVFSEEGKGTIFMFGFKSLLEV